MKSFKEILSEMLLDEETGMFTKEGYFWVYPINNKKRGEWINAFDSKSAKWIYAKKEGLESIGYLGSSKKGFSQH